jgi:hypothetical protein
LVERVLVNRSEPYSGQLIVVSVPRGSAWSLSISDSPYVRDPLDYGTSVHNLGVA